MIPTQSPSNTLSERVAKARERIATISIARGRYDRTITGTTTSAEMANASQAIERAKGDLLAHAEGDLKALSEALAQFEEFVNTPKRLRLDTSSAWETERQQYQAAIQSEKDRALVAEANMEQATEVMLEMTKVMGILAEHQAHPLRTVEVEAKKARQPEQVEAEEDTPIPPGAVASIQSDALYRFAEYLEQESLIPSMDPQEVLAHCAREARMKADNITFLATRRQQEAPTSDFEDMDYLMTTQHEGMVEEGWNDSLEVPAPEQRPHPTRADAECDATVSTDTPAVPEEEGVVSFTNSGLEVRAQWSAGDEEMAEVDMAKTETRERAIKAAEESFRSSYGQHTVMPPLTRRAVESALGVALS